MACATKIGEFADVTMLKMGIWLPGVGLQERIPNHLMLRRLRGAVVSDEEKAARKQSGKYRKDERKQTAEEASKCVKMLSKRVDASSTPMNPDDTCLRSGWQPVYRRHEFCTGFGMERGNLGCIDNQLRYRDGVIRSSGEASVMDVKRRDHVIQQEAGCKP